MMSDVANVSNMSDVSDVSNWYGITTQMDKWTQWTWGALPNALIKNNVKTISCANWTNGHNGHGKNMAS